MRKTTLQVNSIYGMNYFIFASKEITLSISDNSILGELLVEEKSYVHH
tara:strand:+ start:1078 stop:1221 length:144 start_codon:yes stop_codon:yes gene_type:complete